MIMPLETLRELNAEGWPVQPGDMGENITSQGIPYNDFVIGGRYQVGEAVIEIAEPCLACMNLAALPYIGEEKRAGVHPHADPHGGRLALQSPRMVCRRRPGGCGFAGRRHHSRARSRAFLTAPYAGAMMR